MARGRKKPIEDKISAKEELIQSLQTRLKSEQKELEALYSEKKLEDLDSLNELIKTSGLSENEISEAIKSYLILKQQNAS